GDDVAQLRERHGEDAALALLAAHVDGPAYRVYEALGDGEAQARALVVAGQPGRFLLELGKELRQKLMGDANSRIRYPHIHPLFVVPQPDRYASLFGKLDGV